jgi:hypothetical protein
VFLSYRRSDVGGYAGRLTDALVGRLGARHVFHDVSTIGPGQDYNVAIDRALNDADAVLAVIGPGWLTAADASGALRLSEADDYVRRELSLALERGVPVVPVLVGGASLPNAADLPEDLGSLVNRQGVSLHDETWHEDVEALLRSLDGRPPTGQGRDRRLIGGAVAVALLVLAGLGWWLVANRDGDAGDGAGGEEADGVLTGCPSPAGTDWTAIPLTAGATTSVALNGGSLNFGVKDARWREEGPQRWLVVLTATMENATAAGEYHDAGFYEQLVVGRRTNKPWCFTTDNDLVNPDTVSDALVGFEVSCEPVGEAELLLRGGRMRITEATEPGPC